ncbi:MAG: VOC family protein [Bryobacteraceae bacterium]
MANFSVKIDYAGSTMKLTPVLMLDAIEPSLPFWQERLGFEKTVQVPDNSPLDFAILERSGVEVMLQTRESLRKDMPALVPDHAGTGAFLFVEVDDFDDIRLRIEGCEIVVPERVTFYGMREIGVREPGGHCVVFAIRT